MGIDARLGPRVHEQGGIAIVAHPLVPYPLCARPGRSGACWRRTTRASTPTRSRRSTRPPRACAGPHACPEFVGECGVAAVGGSDAHRASNVGQVVTRFPGHTTEDLRAAIAERQTTLEGSAYPWSEQFRMFGRQTRKNARALRDDVGGNAPATRHRPGPRLSRWPAAAAFVQAGHYRRMKIGLVTPYIYPLPGGVNAHVQHLYENLVARGHDVRIISSTHGPQRSSEGDIIRLGYGFSVPTNGSVGTLTVSHRYGELVERVLDDEQFDVLHFHEPFVPFLSLQLLRHSTSVNVATFHAYSGWSPSYEFGKRMLQRFARRLHGRIAVSAAARHFIERYFPGDYKVIPNGVDLRRLRQRRAVRALARRHAEHPVRRPLRAAQGPHVPAQGLPPAAPRRHRCRLLVVGAGPQEREVRRYIATRRLTGVELLGRVSELDKNRAFATADIYSSPATGQESFGIVLLEAMAAGTAIVCSDIHGYKGVVRRGEQALLVPPKDVDALAKALGTLLRDPADARPHGRVRQGASAAVQLGEHHRQGRRLLRLRHPPTRGAGSAALGLPRADPAATPPAHDPDRVRRGPFAGLALCRWSGPIGLVRSGRQPVYGRRPVSVVSQRSLGSGAGCQLRLPSTVSALLGMTRGQTRVGST